MNRKMWAIITSCALLSVVVALLAGSPRGPQPGKATDEETAQDELAQRATKPAAKMRPVKRPSVAAVKPARKTATRIMWRLSLDDALQEARRDHKPLMLDFGAVWCPPCQLLEKEVWPQAKVIAAVEPFVAVKIDVDKHRDLVQRYKVSGFPTVIFLDSNGIPIGSFVGFRDADAAVGLLRAASAKARESIMTARNITDEVPGG